MNGFELLAGELFKENEKGKKEVTDENIWSKNGNCFENLKLFIQNQIHKADKDKDKTFNIFLNFSVRNTYEVKSKIDEYQLYQSKFLFNKTNELNEVNELSKDLRSTLNLKSSDPIFTNISQKFFTYVSYTVYNSINKSIQFKKPCLRENNLRACISVCESSQNDGRKVLKFEKFPKQIISVDKKLVGLINDYEIIDILMNEKIIEESNRILKMSCSSDNQLCYLIANKHLILIVYSFFTENKKEIPLDCLNTSATGSFFFAVISSNLYIKDCEKNKTYILEPPYKTFRCWKDNFVFTSTRQAFDHFFSTDRESFSHELNVFCYDKLFKISLTSKFFSTQRTYSIFKDIIERLNKTWKLITMDEKIVIFNMKNAVWYDSREFFGEDSLIEYIIREKDIVFCLKKPKSENVILEYYPRF